MNLKQKQKMYAHYHSLGWNDGEVSRWGTQDLRGRRPIDIEAAKKAAEKSQKKASKSKDESGE